MQIGKAIFLLCRTILAWKTAYHAGIYNRKMPALIIRSESIYEDQSFNAFDQSEEEFKGIRFIDCVFNACNFSSASFTQCTFNRCSFQNSDLSLLKVNGSTFSKIKFENSKLVGVNWTTASWYTTSASQLVRSINFEKCILNYVSFFGLNLPNMAFSNCIIVEADFSESVLKNADFSGADLKGSLFRKTDLTGANFTGAKNYQISPTDNTITHASFSLPEAFSLLECLDINIS